jgi:hypothetical protein
MSNLKVLLSAAAVAALASTPVFAASHVRHQAPAAPAYSNTVVAPNGQVIGADPDAQIRSEMLRDWPTSAGANSGS